MERDRRSPRGWRRPAKIHRRVDVEQSTLAAVGARAPRTTTRLPSGRSSVASTLRAHASSRPGRHNQSPAFAYRSLTAVPARRQCRRRTHARDEHADHRELPCAHGAERYYEVVTTACRPRRFPLRRRRDAGARRVVRSVHGQAGLCGRRGRSGERSGVRPSLSRRGVRGGAPRPLQGAHRRVAKELPGSRAYACDVGVEASVNGTFADIARDMGERSTCSSTTPAPARGERSRT